METATTQPAAESDRRMRSAGSPRVPASFLAAAARWADALGVTSEAVELNGDT